MDKIKNLTSKQIKGICCIIGGMSIQFIIGSLYSFSALNVYLASYLKRNNTPNLEMTDIYFVVPSIQLLQYITVPIGLKLSEIIGTRFVVVIGSICLTSTYVVLYYFTQFKIILFSMIIFGIGDGLCYLTVVRNAWRYFPNKVGLVNGIIQFGLGISSAILNPIGDFVIINPKKEKTLDDGFYDKDIVNNFKNYILFCLTLSFILSLIACSCTFSYKEEISENETQDNQKETPLVNNEINEKKKEMIKKGLFTKQSLFLLILQFGGPFFCILLSNTNRHYGNSRNVDPLYLQVMALAFAILNGVFRIIWGFLIDMFKFKILMGVDLFVQIIVALTIKIFVKFSIVYVIENVIIGACLSGVYSLIPPVFKKIFGLEVGPQIFSIISPSAGISSFTGPVITKFLIKEEKDYDTLYYLCAGVVGICIVINFILSDDKYIFFGEEIGEINNGRDSIEKKNDLEDNLFVPSTTNNENNKQKNETEMT